VPGRLDFRAGGPRRGSLNTIPPGDASVSFAVPVDSPIRVGCEPLPDLPEPRGGRPGGALGERIHREEPEGGDLAVGGLVPQHREGR